MVVQVDLTDGGRVTGGRRRQESTPNPARHARWEVTLASLGAAVLWPLVEGSTYLHTWPATSTPTHRCDGDHVGNNDVS